MQPRTPSRLPADLLSFLGSVEPFCRVTDQALADLDVDVIRLNPGEFVFQKGDQGDALYVIQSGTCSVLLPATTGEYRVVTRLGSGEMIGEMAVVNQQPRTATVQADTPTSLLRLSVPAFERLAADSQEIVAYFQQVAVQRESRLRLILSKIFPGLEAGTMDACLKESESVRVEGGQTLFHQGDPSDSLYAVVHGRLQAIIQPGNEAAPIVREIPRGTCVGEMGLLTNEPRSATIRAVRDSELLRFSQTQFTRLLDSHPQVGAALARTLAHRLRQANGPPAPSRVPTTLAILPGSAGVAGSGFAERLAEALSQASGPTLHVTSRMLDQRLGQGSAQVPVQHAGHARIVNWLNDQEDHYRHLVFECDPSLSRWTERCLRQADLVLLVYEACESPARGDLQIQVEQRQLAGSTRRELVLVHADDVPHPSNTSAWLGALQAETHHHLRMTRTSDYARLARFLTGRAVSLVLGGGGARGFAHIGVLRALGERGIPADLVAGTSMGAIIAAQHALGYDSNAMIAMNRRTFQEQKLYLDTTIPLVSLMTAKKIVAALRTMFGDTAIEDLWTKYFCVSSNLTRAQANVHQTGPLWLAIRASISVPGVTPPVSTDGDLLVDGGLLNNLPADLVRRFSEGPVIAVDVASRVDLKIPGTLRPTLSGWRILWSRLNPFAAKSSLPNIFNILARSAMLGSVSGTDALKTSVDLYIQPPTGGISLFDWHAIDRAADLGYRYASELLDRGPIPRTLAPVIPSERRSP